MRGTKPQTTAARKLRGNPGKRSYNKQEPEPPLMESGAVPDELRGDPVASKEWRRVVPMLRRIKQVTDADRMALIAMCREWSKYIGTKNANGRELRQWLGELGLTPSSRSRVKVAEGPIAGGDEFSEFDDPPSMPMGAAPPAKAEPLPDIPDPTDGNLH